MKILRAVINTSPWISLAICGQTETLPKLYQQVFMPPTVRKEILAGGKSLAGVQELRNAARINTVDIQDPSKVVLLHELDQGEAEVILLVQEQKIHEVIIDEKVARMEARVLGLEVTGTLGLLLRMKKYGLVPQIRPLIEKLLKGGIYIHKDIIDGIIDEAKE